MNRLSLFVSLLLLAGPAFAASEDEAGDVSRCSLSCAFPRALWN